MQATTEVRLADSDAAHPTAGFDYFDSVVIVVILGIAFGVLHAHRAWRARQGDPDPENWP